MDTLSSMREALAGRYDVRDVAGQGGMAVVLRATRLADGRDVAIKVLDRRLREVLGPARFQREIAILTGLSHPGLLPVLDAGDAGGCLYYVMPFVSGETLEARLARDIQLPIADAVAIARTVLDALAYAHAQNVVHRDIKPANILLEGGAAVLADFGVARAIVRAGGESISSTGVTVGTPTYMSPEQTAGSAAIDGRSDLYSLGCVLYEMLAGAPPFSGSTMQALAARHLHESAPPLRVVRPDVPEALESVIRQSLAKTPAERFASAGAFAAALDRALEPSFVRPRGRRRLGAAAALAGMVVLVVVAALSRGGPPLVAHRYVVFPLQTRGEIAAGGLGADAFTRLVWHSLRRWRDLDVVDMALVEDRMRRGTSAASLSGAVGLARSLAAGLVVFGEVGRLGDSLELRVSLYRTDGTLRNAVRHATVMLPASGSAEDGHLTAQVASGVARLARALLPAGVPDPGGLVATPYYAALRATLEGDSALIAWDLPLARERYREAFTIDPAYAAPRLRYAQAALWSDEPVAVWRPAAEAALASVEQLDGAERMEAEALVALGRGDFPAACAGFGRLIERYPASFNGWFGRGECLSRDTVVVRDPRSPSGWLFRGSYAAAVDAYLRALTLVPLAHLAYDGPALSRLSAKLFAEPNRLRFGASPGPNGRRFAAAPAMLGDTVALVPYPIDEVLGARQVPATLARAIAANRERLLAITSEWLATYPGSQAAVRAHAWALELAGRLQARGAEPGALDLVHRLRDAPERAADIELLAWEARLRLKRGEMTRAAALADTALALSPSRTDEGVLLAGLAALSGRANRAAELLARFGTGRYVLPDGETVEVPPAVAADANRLLVFAGFGGPRDSILAIAARVRAAVDRHAAPPERERIAEAAMFRPALLAYPVLPAPAGEGFSVVRIQRALGRGDGDAAARAFERLDAVRSRQLPGAVSPDHVVLEARLRALAGDTAKARHQLDELLDNLSALGSDLLDETSQAAAVGRALALYAALGGARVHRDTALAALWQGADPWLMDAVRRHTGNPEGGGA